MHNTDMGKRQSTNRCGLPVTRTEIAARKCRTKAATWPAAAAAAAVGGVLRGRRSTLGTQVTCCQKEKRQNTRYKRRRRTIRRIGMGIEIEMRIERGLKRGRAGDSLEAARQTMQSASLCGRRSYIVTNWFMLQLEDC